MNWIIPTFFLLLVEVPHPAKSEIVNAEVNTVPNNLFIVLFLFDFINFVFFDSIQTTTPSLHMSSSQLVSR